MAKRKSITVIKKKHGKPSTSTKTVTVNPVPRNHSRSMSLDPIIIRRPRQLISTKDASSHVPLINSLRARKTLDPLKPTLRHVSQDTIQTKWKVLDKAAQAKVQALFLSVKLPVLAKHMSGKSKVEAQEVIALLTRILYKRLPKMPFPPKTKESDFDPEVLFKEIRDFKQQLSTSATSINVLKIELEKQKRALEMENQELVALERVIEDQENGAGRPWILTPLEESAPRDDTPVAIGLFQIDLG